MPVHQMSKAAEQERQRALKRGVRAIRLIEDKIHSVRGEEEELLAERAEVIRETQRAGVSYREIGEALGVSAQYVEKMKRTPLNHQPRG